MRFPFAFYRVKDRSMEPAVKENGFLFVSTMHSGLRNGDIVVLRHPTERITIVKRIKSIDGDAVFVVGDNSAQSQDSRSFGPVDRKSVVGKVLLVV